MDGLEPGLLEHFQPWADDVLRGAEEGNWRGVGGSLYLLGGSVMVERR